VHGAWLGGWCWTHLAPHLQDRGHAVVTVDLPGSSPGVRSLDYARVVLDAVDDVDADLVLVGHSLAGLTIPIVAAHRPVRRLVYLCGVLRDPGRSLAQSSDDGTDADMTPEPLVGLDFQEDGTSQWADEVAATRFLCQDAEPALARWAFRRLRPQYSLWTEVSPIDHWPDAQASYILCTDDRLVSPQWARRAAQEKLGVQAVELPGGHSPYLSRPAELAEVLCRDL